MADCDMCGKYDASIDAVVEGVLLKVCGDCARHGKVVQITPKVVKQEIPVKKTIKVVEEAVQIIDPDYADIVRKARERLGLKQSELALKMAEKESLIHNVERGHIEPSIDLAKKLEHFLRVQLIKEYKEERRRDKIDFHDDNLTIGDLLKSKK